MTEYIVFLIEILHKDYRVVFVDVPPLVVILEVCLRVLFSGLKFPRLAGTSGSAVPLVLLFSVC